MWIKACYSRRVPNVNSGSIVEVLNKEYRLLDHALGNCSCIALITYIHVGIRVFQSLLLKSNRPHFVATL